MGGAYPFKRELNTSLAYAPKKDNFIRLEEPIEIYSDLGKINKLTLPYDAVPNKIEAKGVLVADSEKVISAEFKGVDTRYCKVEFRVNGDLKHISRKTGTKKARFISSFEVKHGRNTFTVAKNCNFAGYITSYKPFRFAWPQGVTFRDFNHPANGINQMHSSGGLAFRFVDFETEEAITTIKNRIRVQEKLPLDINYSEAEKADPVLWSWIGNHYSYFTGSDQVQLDENEQSIVRPKKLQVNLFDMELIKENGQKLDFSQEMHARKNMFKGTFFPKTIGIHEVLVVKKTNISIVHDNDSFLRKKRNFPDYAYPIYSLAFDYSRPVGHSSTRQGHTGQKPIEYDWFWFEVDEDDVKYGMDMSLMVHGNTGLLNNSHGQGSLPEADESHFLYDKATKELIKTHDALKLGIKASQKIGFYIKPARAKKFRKFQQSDFAKIDGSTSKHGHDIDGSSEGRINGLNKLDRSEDQPLKDNMELLGGFD